MLPMFNLEYKLRRQNGYKKGAQNVTLSVRKKSAFAPRLESLFKVRRKRRFSVGNVTIVLVHSLLTRKTTPSFKTL